MNKEEVSEDLWKKKIFIVKRMFISYLMQQFKKNYSGPFDNKAFVDSCKKLIESDQIQEEFIRFINTKSETVQKEKISLFQKGKTFIKDLFREKTSADYQKIIADQLWFVVLSENKNYFTQGESLFPILEKCGVMEFDITTSIAPFFGYFTPLTYACFHGYEKLVDKLLRLHADVNYPDSDLNLPLHLSVKFGHYDIVQTLLRQPNIDKECLDYKTGRTPLQEAVFCGYPDIVGLLLINGVQFDNQEKLLKLAQEGKKYWWPLETKREFEKRDFNGIQEVIRCYKEQMNESQKLENSNISQLNKEPIKIMSDKRFHKMILSYMNPQHEHV